MLSNWQHHGYGKNENDSEISVSARRKRTFEMEFPKGSIIVLLSVFLTNHIGAAIVCYKCDSVSLAACATTLDGAELPYETCTSLTCAMSIVDSVTYRGCSSNTPSTGAAYRKTCGTNLCNRGVYPPGRLKCHQCSGSACVAAQAEKPRPCLYHHEEDACYTDVVNATHALRGCRSDTNSSHTATTVYCDTNGCNNQAGAVQLQCIECDSQQGRGCKMDLFEVNASRCNITVYGTCEVSSLLARNQTCFLYHSKSRVARGCSRDLPPDLAADTAHLQHCNNASLCNGQCLKQRSCLECDSTLQPLCRTNATALRSGVCGSAEVSSCYAAEYSDNRVRRGCGPPPSGEADVSRSYECDASDGCNAVAFTRCYRCSSTVNPNCATWETPGDVSIEECAVEGAPCVIGVLADGRTVRGCQSTALHCNATLTSCSTCEGSFCNKGMYPPNRLRCQQCRGAADSECASATTEPLPCLPAAEEPQDERQACLEYVDHSGQMVRGCRSDLQLYADCLVSQQTNAAQGCNLCYEDGCNETPLQRAPSLQCFQCDRDDANCRWAQTADAGSLRTCSTPVDFGGADESCFTRRLDDGSIERGCTLDAVAENFLVVTDEGIDFCYSSGCNSAPGPVSEPYSLVEQPWEEEEPVAVGFQRSGAARWALGSTLLLLPLAIKICL